MDAQKDLHIQSVPTFTTKVVGTYMFVLDGLAIHARKDARKSVSPITLECQCGCVVLA